jgi:hypothetical protein
MIGKAKTIYFHLNALKMLDDECTKRGISRSQFLNKLITDHFDIPQPGAYKPRKMRKTIKEAPKEIRHDIYERMALARQVGIREKKIKQIVQEYRQKYGIEIMKGTKPNLTYEEAATILDERESSAGQE